ncbi:MAG: FG-GAP repeat protein [Planctomycetes bacterium]|nr:FG-GAP repeat protein [Planctomycetota bacterium]
MNRLFFVRRSAAALCVALLAISATVGMQCPPDEDAPLNPPIATGNRAPRVQITDVTTPKGDGSAEQGELVTIKFTAQDTEDRANVRVFASASDNPTAADEIPILTSFPVGPGEGSGTAFWRTNNVTPGSYFLFAEINDGSFNANDNTGNRPVVSTWADPVLIVPEGIGDENAAPVLTIDLPATDAGLSNDDVLTVRYNVSDADSDTDTLVVRVLFDRDRSTSNDATDVPLEVATQTLAPGTIAPGAIGLIQNDITIDLNVLPIRLETDEGRRPLPYFVRVQIDDGQGHVINKYAVGAIRLLRAPSDVVDLINTGSTVAGATWQGFDGNPVNPAGGSRAGSVFASPGDIDGDGFDDFLIGAETASPFNQSGVGEVYLIYGRQRRIPSDFAAILGYGSGRYAGVNALNTVGSYVPFPSTDPRFQRYFNIRGTIIPQEASLGFGSGVSSIVGMPDSTGDGRPDFMVGLASTSSVFDQEDVDPCDSCTFDDAIRAPFPCLSDIVLRSGSTALVGEAEEIEMVNAGQWAPVDPVGLSPLFPEMLISTRLMGD